ncbi:hypothetical protein OCU04_010436 [Sclerotinia nivalis]|uniref:Uncharacterized protein n=1 Tax=Sclerotinia nivalis TaxID=352851 RepID=A0A9X0DGA7_9HELO|nr:hypothetical protein OCU04_010436 [Sclerotinia nivalis]
MIRKFQYQITVPEPTQRPWYWFCWGSNNDTVIRKRIAVLEILMQAAKSVRLQREIKQQQSPSTDVDGRSGQEEEVVRDLRDNLNKRNDNRIKKSKTTMCRMLGKARTPRSLETR